MKRLNHLLGICLLLSAILFSSCKKKEVPPITKTAAEKAAEFLSKTTWEADKVMWESTDLTQEDMYTNFTLDFTADSEGGTYTTTNGDPAFPATGTWSFGEVTSENAFNIVRDDKVEMEVSVTTGGMTLDFEMPGSSTARINGTEGPIQFVLVPASN